VRTPRRIVALVGGGLVVLALGFGAWYFLSQPAKPGQPVNGPPVPPPSKHKLQARNNTTGSMYLVRVKGAPDTTEPDAFWEGLFTEMAKDKETAALLRKLFGGLRVQLVALETLPAGADPVWGKNPADDFDVVLRVCNSGPHALRTDQGTTSAGKAVPIEYLVGSLSAGVVIDADPPDDLPKSASAGFQPPEFLDAWKLALEDHLLRKKVSWRGIYVGSVGEHKEFNRVAENANQSPEEARKALDARIEEFAKGYREYLGGLK
jgi:hypothetical protein